PTTDDPTYSGCAVQRYGPVEVTSLAFLTWPAAQIRIASPARAMTAPTATVAGVGDASHNTTTANAKPSGTRLRASASARRARNRASASARRPDSRATRSNTRRLGRKAALDGGQYFLDVYVHETHRVEFAATQMAALADRIARHDRVGRRPRTVARRTGRSVNPDDRGPDRRCDVRRSGIARDHQRRAARERHQVGNGRRRREGRRTVRRRDGFLGDWLFARAPRDHRRQAVAIAQRHGDSAEA